MTRSDPNESLEQHVALLRASYHHWTGEHLIDANLNAGEAVEALRSAPFAVVSHGSEEDPIFNYGNRRALQLFEMDWDNFTRLPSRLSSATLNQESRGTILAEVSRRGFVRAYSGLRVAKSGRQFRILDTTIWNLVTADGGYRGQAAFIGNVEEL